MRLVRINGEAGDFATNQPPHPGRVTAHYPIYSKAKILSPISPFAVLRQFSPILAILTSARGESVNRAGFSKGFIAGNRHLHAVNLISAGI